MKCLISGVLRLALAAIAACLISNLTAAQDSTTTAPKEKSASQPQGAARADAPIDGHQLRNLRELETGRTPSSLLFPVLHEERLWALDEERRLSSRIDDLRTQIHSLSQPILVVTREEYETRMRRIDQDIDASEHKQVSGPSESDKVDAHLALIALTRQKGALGAAWEESQIYDLDRKNQEGFSVRPRTFRVIRVG